MRFTVMHKVDANMEAGAPPNQDIIQAMGQLVREGLTTGTFENGAGLHRSALRIRLDFRGSKCTVTKGPFTGQNELIAAFFMIKTAAMENAIEQAGRFATILGDVEIEIGPVVEPWDLGLVPKPVEPQAGRFLLLLKGGARTERAAPDPEVRAALAQLQTRMTEEGLLLAAEWIAPSSSGSRLASVPKGKRTWVDGPFSESKELVAGFSLMNLPNKQSVLAWAERYAAILGGNEVDVREIAD